MTEEASSRGGRSRAALAFAAMASVYFFSYFQRSAVPGTIFDELQAALGLGAGGVTALGSLFTWIYGGMQIVVGLLVDAQGGRRPLLFGGLLMTVGALLFPLAGEAPAFFATRALTGLGTSFIYLSIIKELSLVFNAEGFAAMLGTMLAVGYIGAMAATLPFERAVAAFGWRPSLLFVAALMVAALAAAWWTTGRARQGQAPRGSSSLRSLQALRSIPAIFANRRCWPILGSSLVTFPIFFVIQTIVGKKFLQDFGNLSSAAAAAFMLVMAAASAVTALAGGFISRLFANRRRPPILIGASLLVAALVILLAGTLLRAPGWVLLVGYILLSASLVGGPATYSTMRDLGSPDSVGTGFSVLNALSYLGCGTVGQFGGLMLDRFGSNQPLRGAPSAYPPAAYSALFGYLLALGLANFALALAIAETGGPARGGTAAA